VIFGLSRRIADWPQSCTDVDAGCLSSGKKREAFMLIGLFVVLMVLWLLGFTVFHVAGGLIHLLIILAVISLIMHFVRGRSVV